MNNKIAGLYFLVLFAASCTTSLKIRETKGSDSSDSVKTLKAPPVRAVDLTADSDGDKFSDENTQRKFDQLKGELENARFQSEQREKELQARVALLESENTKLKADLVEAAKAAPEKAEATGKSADDTAKLLWDSAVAALEKNDKSRAVDSFKSLVTSYPKSEYAHSSQVGLGMLYYSQQDFKSAALHFNTAIEKFPKKRNGISIVEFGVAASVHQLGNREDAKLFFEELVRKYPKSSGANQAKSILAKKSKVPEDLFKSFPNWLDLIR
jgi:TolA-binding protein